MKIAILPGDGIGTEIVAQAERVMACLDSCKRASCDADTQANAASRLLVPALSFATTLCTGQHGTGSSGAREHWLWLPVTGAEGRLGPVQKSRISIMSLGTILVILLILILLGVIPSWGYSGNWGYGPSGIVGTILVIVVILLLLGRI